MNDKAKELLDKILNDLHKLEDLTSYENKNVSEAINLLQKEL